MIFKYSYNCCHFSFTDLPRAIYIVKKYYTDVATYYAAMLHDALEDGIPLGNIENEEEFFSMLAAELPAAEIDQIDDIYNSVVDLTKPEGADYFSYVINLTKNPIAFRVKLADMMQNISDNPSERQIKKYVKAKNLLVDKFGDKPPTGINAAHWRAFKKTVDDASK